MAERLRGRLVLGFGDQAVSSLSNVLFTISVARASSSEQFGAFTVGLTALTFVMAVSRSTLGTLLSVRTRERDVGFGSPDIRGILTLSFVFVLAGFVTTGLVGLGTGALGQIPGLYLLLMTVGPLVVVQDVLRFAAVSFRRPSVALLSDGLWLLLVAVALGVDLALSGVQLSPLAYLCVWLTGMVVALAILVITLRASPSFEHARRTLPRLRGDLSRLLAEGTLTSITPLLVASITAMFLSLRETAGLRGANVLLGPIAVLISAMTLVVVPELASSTSHRDRKRIQRWFLFGLSGVALSWGALLTFLPDDVGRAILGPTWAWAALIIPITTLEYVVMATGAVANTALKAEGRFGAVLLTKGLYVTATLVGVALVVVLGAGIRAVATSLVVAAAVNSVSAWMLLKLKRVPAR